MKYIPGVFILCVIALLILSGCSTIAHIYDTGDPCLVAQQQHKPMPKWCTNSGKTVTVRDSAGRFIGTYTIEP